METEATERPKSRKIRVTDVLVVVVLVVICIFLVITLVGQLSERNEVRDAKTVSNRIISDIAKQDARDARTLADQNFRNENTLENLTAQFKAAKAYTHGTPMVVKQIVNNDKYGDAVGIIYRYPDKPVYYIRIVVTKPKGNSSWHMTSISGNNAEQPLLK